jgi:hypothetical protein
MPQRHRIPGAISVLERRAKGFGRERSIAAPQARGAQHSRLRAVLERRAKGFGRERNAAPPAGAIRATTVTIMSGRGND